MVRNIYIFKQSYNIMKIGSKVTTRKAPYFKGIIIQTKTINYFGKKMNIHKVEMDGVGIEWINEMYLEKLQE